MDIQEIRRHNLESWLKTHSVPRDEKSYFSQLRAGASFGERAARRLEEKYGMGSGFLDRVPDNSSNRGQKPPLSDEAESLIQEVLQLDARGGLSLKWMVIVRSILQLAGESSQDKNHASGVHQVTMPEIREAEKALGMTLEGHHESGHRRRAKGR